MTNKWIMAICLYFPFDTGTWWDHFKIEGLDEEEETWGIWPFTITRVKVRK